MYKKLIIIAASALAVLTGLLHDWHHSRHNSVVYSVVTQQIDKIKHSAETNMDKNTVETSNTIEEAIDSLEQDDINLNSLTEKINTLPQKDKEKVMQKTFTMLINGDIDSEQFFLPKQPYATK